LAHKLRGYLAEDLLSSSSLGLLEFSPGKLVASRTVARHGRERLQSTSPLGPHVRLYLTNGKALPSLH